MILPALLASCSTVSRAGASQPALAKAKVAKSEPALQRGIASIYTDYRTASGEKFRSSALCAAHKTLPLGSRIRVTHAGTGKSVIVRINDRGPFVKGRVIDLTPAAANAIGLTKSQGITRVELHQVD